MVYTNHDALLLTVIHSGTRSANFYLRNNKGLKIMSFHMVPAGWRYVSKCKRQITTIRNPYKVAASWVNNRIANRFKINEWEAQWTLWHKAVTEYNFEVIVIENLDAPIKGKTVNPKQMEVPIDKVQFALDLIKDTGIIYPDYYGEAHE